MKVADFYDQFIQTRIQKNLYRKLNGLSHVSSRALQESDRSYINFSSNDYLGLRFNTQMIKASNNMTKSYGCGSGSSRLVSGNFDFYLDLEAQIARWKGFEASLIMGSGFDCNLSVLESLLSKNVFTRYSPCFHR